MNARNAFLDVQIFRDIREFTQENAPIIANGTAVESNSFKDPLWQFIIALIQVKDPMFVNTIPAANHSAM